MHLKPRPDNLLTLTNDKLRSDTLFFLSAARNPAFFPKKGCGAERKVLRATYLYQSSTSVRFRSHPSTKNPRKTTFVHINITSAAKNPGTLPIKCWAGLVHHHSGKKQLFASKKDDRQRFKRYLRLFPVSEEASTSKAVGRNQNFWEA